MNFEIDYPKIYGFFYKRINSLEDVEDMAMEVVMEITRAENEKREELHWGYIWQICRNKLADFYERRNKHKISALDENIEREDQSYSLHYKTDIETLRNLMEKYLKPEESDLIQKIYIQGFSYEEIGKDWGEKPVNLRKKASRILEKLKVFYR